MDRAMPHYGDLAELVAMLGDPYSGEVDGRPVGRHRADTVTAEVEQVGPSHSTATNTDYCLWNCLRLLAELDRSSFEVLNGSGTTRLRQYARAVQELTALSSCAAIRQLDGTWTMLQMCCLHERRFEALP